MGSGSKVDGRRNGSNPANPDPDYIADYSRSIKNRWNGHSVAEIG